MNGTKLDWSDLALFLAVARGGGLARGAEITGISPPSLGRHMVTLEQAMGEILFDRLPRGYRLTQAGEALLNDAETVEQSVFAIERRLDRTDPSLPVFVTAGTWMTWFLVRNIDAITKDGTRLVFQAGEAVQSIARRETTIGLRNIRPSEPGLAIRKTTRINFAPFVSPNGNAKQWVASNGQTASARWVQVHKRNEIGVEVSHPRSLLDLALEGAGQVLLPCFVGDSTAGLVRAGPIVEELSHDQWLVVHDEDRHSPPVRATIDALTKLITKHRPLFSGAI
jgi:DNA-binding transcriptional LysR family regulator